jgi:VanZ family protein
LPLELFSTFSLMNRNYIYLIIWMLLIIYASLSSPDGIPNMVLFAHADKVVHFLMYFGLSILMLVACFRNRIQLKSLILSTSISFFVGLLMEFLQYSLTTTRFASVYDILFNLMGSITGVLVFRFLISGTSIERIVFKN